MLPASPDDEERRLLAEYRTATRRYSRFVSEPSRERGSALHDNFDKILKLVEQARADCETARYALWKFRNSKSRRVQAAEASSPESGAA
jgi:hypothetical protein